MPTSTRPLIQAIHRGDVATVTSLLHSGEDYLRVDSRGWTALHWAVSRQETGIAAALLEHHEAHRPSNLSATSTLDDVDYERASIMAARHVPSPICPLDLAADNDDLESFELLLEHLEVPESSTMQLNTLWARPPPTPLTQSSNFWHTNEDISRYLEEAAPWNSRTRLAHLAIHRSKPNILCLLLKAGVDINERFLFNKQTLLHTAAFQRDPQYVCILVRAGADPTLTDDWGRTALQQALGRGLIETARVLLEAGAPVNMCPSAHQFPPFAWSKVPADASPLMLACGLKEVEPAVRSDVVRQLLERGADPNADDRRGRTALHVAAVYCDMGIIQQLIQAGANPAACSLSQRTVYHYFGQRQPSSQESYPDLIAILRFLLSQFDPREDDLPDSAGFHPLEVAAQAAQPAVLRALVDCSFVAEEFTSQYGVESAVNSRDVRLLNLWLPEEKLKLSDTDADSMYPLTGLVSTHKGLVVLPPETVEAVITTIRLLDSARIFHERDATSALRLVVRHFRNAELVQVLLDCGAKAFGESTQSWDLFHEAAVYGNREVLRCLLDNAGKAPSPDHWFAYSKSMKPTSDDTGNVLLCMKEVGLLDSSEVTSYLNAAILDGNMDVVKRLILHSSNIESPDSHFEWRPLHAAVYSGRTDIVKLLLNAGAKVDSYTLRWGINDERLPRWKHSLWTAQPLHIAALYGYAEIAEMLADAGANVNAAILDAEDWEVRSMGQRALELSLTTKRLHCRGGLPVVEPLNRDRLRVAELLVKHGAHVADARLSFTWTDIPRFEGFEYLWDNLQLGRFVQ